MDGHMHNRMNGSMGLGHHASMNHSDGGHMGHNMSVTDPMMTRGHMGHGGDTVTGNMPRHSAGEHALHFNFILPIRVLFFEWSVETNGQLIASFFGIFVIAILYEGLKVWRQCLLQKTNMKRSSSSKDSINSASDEFNIRPSKVSRFCNGYHFLQSFLHVIQTTIGMFLMLINMTFNVWLAIAVSLGVGVGYLLFGWMVPSDPSFGNHCK